MSAPELHSTVNETLPEDLTEVGVYASLAEAEEHGLVVLALGRDYWLVPASPEGGYRLLVEPDAAAPARRHLAAYARERLRWPPAPIDDPWTAREAAFTTPLLWAALVLALHRYDIPWREAAVLDATAVFGRGEWWRAATALFLHGDAAHVLSNVLGGLFVFTAVISTLGRLRGWLLIALAAIAGNLVTAAIHYPAAYRSVGASTAIFAGVGLLTGRAIRIVARTKHPHRWRAMFVPFAAGVTVFALHGFGAARADVGAHLFGFVAGLTVGFLVALRSARA